MFCPKCGTKNPDDGKFCRKCGTDLAPVTQMLSGVTPKYTSSKKKRGRRNHTWESAMRKLFS
ncbi:MAG: zinc-ribbon domain-containing protein, partial [Acidobacteriota bacterium]|nr:zinc-ribbon domain-containing protein [Acidobacteriota bacterium]